MGKGKPSSPAPPLQPPQLSPPPPPTIQSHHHHHHPPPLLPLPLQVQAPSSKIQLACANCKASLNVPHGSSRFVCPQCGIDPTEINQFGHKPPVDFKINQANLMSNQEFVEQVNEACRSLDSEILNKREMKGTWLPLCSCFARVKREI